MRKKILGSGSMAKTRCRLPDDEDTSQSQNHSTTTSPPSPPIPSQTTTGLLGGSLCNAVASRVAKFKIPQMSFECFARSVLYYYDDYSKRKLSDGKNDGKERKRSSSSSTIKLWCEEKGSKCQVECGNVLHKLAKAVKLYKGMHGKNSSFQLRNRRNL